MNTDKMIWIVKTVLFFCTPLMGMQPHKEGKAVSPEIQRVIKQGSTKTSAIFCPKSKKKVVSEPTKGVVIKSRIGSSGLANTDEKK